MPWRAVLAVAGAAVVVLVLVSPNYGWHRDEVYFLAAGQHLAWGFVDQPPLAPAVARLAHEIAPGSLPALRLIPALVTGVTIVLGALLVRELGGRRAAQIVGALAMASTGFVLGSGHQLSTTVFDLAAWMGLITIAACLLRRTDPRWWVPFGAVTGAALYNKHLVVLLAGALGIGLVIERRWDLLWSPWLVAGAGLTLLIASPNLWWQATHGWPQLEMARVLSDRIGGESRLQMLPVQVLLVGPPLVLLLWRGVRWLHRDPRAQPFRPLLWAWPAGLAMAFVTGGRPYYVVPLALTAMLAGVVATAQANRLSRLPWLIGVNAVATMLIALPVLPVDAVRLTGMLNSSHVESIGWPELADQVAAVVETLPEDERGRAILLTLSYGEAGALAIYGPDRDLPPVYSPHNSYADFGQPTDDHAVVVAVRFAPEHLEPHFSSCEHAATIDNGIDLANEVQGAPVNVCRGLHGSWTDLWEQLRFLS